MVDSNPPIPAPRAARETTPLRADGRRGPGDRRPRRTSRPTAAWFAPLRSPFEVPYKAGRIVKDYVFDLYFRAQRLSWWQRLGCTPMLLLVEYLVYRVDAIAERGRHLDLDPGRSADENARRYRATFAAYKERLQSLLRQGNAYSTAVAHQLEQGEKYVYLENKVTSTRTADHAQILQLAELRPSDVRLLHAMIFAMRGRPVDRNLVDLLWPVEVLADIGNDLDHYHADVVAGRYNTYDAFVRLYGPSAPERLRAEIARYEALFEAQLARFPGSRQAELARLCARRYRPRVQAIPVPRFPTEGAA